MQFVVSLVLIYCPGAVTYSTVTRLMLALDRGRCEGCWKWVEFGLFIMLVSNKVLMPMYKMLVSKGSSHCGCLSWQVSCKSLDSSTNCVSLSLHFAALALEVHQLFLVHFLRTDHAENTFDDPGPVWWQSAHFPTWWRAMSKDPESN